MAVQKQIVSITAQGLTYLDEHGDERFIDFAECYERKLAAFMEPAFLKYYQDINAFDAAGLQDSIERRKAWKVVAVIDFIGEPETSDTRYIDFYSDPPTRFVFESFDEVFNVIDLMQQFGWVTFDDT